MRKLAFLICFLFLTVAVYADGLDSLYKAIDAVIMDSDKYLSKKEHLLDSIRIQITKTVDVRKKFDLEYSLFQEYRPYQNDSALTSISHCIALAEKLGDNNLTAFCRIKKALQNSISGFYTEAQYYISKVDGKQLADSVLQEYYYTYSHLYGEMARYTQDKNLTYGYYKLSDAYLDSLLSMIEKDSFRYQEYLETQYYKARDFKSALKINDARIKSVQIGTHDYAKVAYFRGVDYGELGYKTEQKYWLAQSALCDIKNCVMDQASLWSLAGILNSEGDLERSYRYVEYSWICTSKFSGHVRSWLVSPVLTMINNKYKENLNRANNRLRFLLISVGLLAILMTGLFFYVSRKRHQLATARNLLKLSNDNLMIRSQELSLANERLLALNEELTTLNEQLAESSSIKEAYIGKFFSLCSEYIDKLDQYRSMVKRKLKARQYEDLFRISQDEQMKAAELTELYSKFDSIFLHIFPTFVEDFNSLLKPEFRIQQLERGKLHTDIRIFALIRLGIEDSSKIAEFLHYSPNTIYNYRARLKGKSIDRDSFEDDIKKIGVK